MANLKIEKAKISDVVQIQKIINFQAQKGKMLSLSLNEIYDRLRDFWVAKKNNKIIGTCALHICWENLAEIRSLSVINKEQKKGIGALLVKECLNEAKLLGINKIFTLTYVDAFFKKIGFKKIDKSKLPHKIWKDCINCPNFPDCKEVSLIYTSRDGGILVDTYV